MGLGLSFIGAIVIVVLITLGAIKAVNFIVSKKEEK